VTIKAIVTFVILLGIFIFIYTLLGMELFAYKVWFSEDEGEILPEADGGVPPRVNFNGIWNALITIFIVFIGEDWNSVMYSHYREFKHLSTFFFISFFVIGNLVLLNLFLAILLQNFETDGEEEEGKDSDANALAKLRRSFRRKWRIVKYSFISKCVCFYKKKGGSDLAGSVLRDQRRRSSVGVAQLKHLSKKRDTKTMFGVNL